MSGLDDKSRAAILVALCPLSLALMGMGVKFANQLPIAIILLARFGISATIYSAWLLATGFAFRTIRPLRHILRTLLGFSSVACLFASISVIPLSTALCLSYTVPIFSYVISICIRQLKPDRRIFYVLGAIAAVAMIVQPSANVNAFGALLGLASAFFGALALFEIKRISRTEGSDAILFMYFLYSTFVLIAYLLIADHRNAFPDISQTTPALIAVGVFGLLYQFSLVGALGLASVAVVSLALLVAVALGYGIDILVFGIDVNVWAVCGTGLLALCIGAYSRGEP